MSVIIFGHRGFPAHRLENTLEGFRYAILQGVSAIECDLILIEDTFFVFHDRRTGRVASCDRSITEITAGEMKALKLNNGESPPTLEELISEIGGKVKLNLELKGDRGGAELVRALKRYPSNIRDTFLVSSFSQVQLSEFAKGDSEVSLGVLFYGDLERYEFPWLSRRPFSVHLSYDYLSESLVKLLHGKGYQVYCYTVQHEDEVKKCIDCGVDGVFADDPIWARKIEDSLKVASALSKQSP